MSDFRSSRLAASSLVLTWGLLFPCIAFSKPPTKTQGTSDVERTLSAMRSSTSSVVLVAAHRGGYANDQADEAPENSVENIANCHRRSYDLYETDIQRTKDGQFVIVHDATIDRETNSTGEVKQMTLAELKGLRKRYRDGRLSAARVATLKQFLVEGKGRTIFKADLKPGVSEHFGELVELVNRLDSMDGIVFRVHYRELPVFERHLQSGMEWPRSLVMFRVKNKKQLDEVVDKFAPTIIHIDVRRDDPANTKTLELIRYARSHGLHVQVHAEGTRDDWWKLVEAGVRMFHTTAPDEVVKFCRSLASPDQSTTRN